MNDTIDTLKIKVEGEGQSAVKTLDDLITTLERVKGTTSSRSIGTLTSKLESLKSSINDIKTKNLSKLNAIFSTLSNANKINISPRLPERIRELGEAVDTLDGIDFSKLNEMASGLSALSRVGHVNLPRVNGGSNGDNADSVTSDLEGTEEVAPRVVSEDSLSRMDRFSSKLSEIKDKIKSVSSKAKSAGSRIKEAFSTSILGKFVSKVKETITALGRIALYRIMRSLIKQVTDAFSTGISDMYQYSLTFSGSFSTSMDRASSALLSFKNSLAAAITPLIEYLVPYLDKAVDRLMEINNTIAMVIAGLTGKSTYSKAVRVTTTYADAANDAADNTSKVKDSVDNLKRSLAGLDEITIIGDNNSSVASSIADAVSDATDYSIMFEETPVDMAKVDEIKEKLESILTTVGLIGTAIAAWNFAKALTGVSGLNSALTLAGITLTLVGATLLFKGIKEVITDGMDWDNFWTLFFGSASITAGTTVLGKVISRMTGNSSWTSTGTRVGLGVSGLAMLFSGLYSLNDQTWDNVKSPSEYATWDDYIDAMNEQIDSQLTGHISSALGGAALGTAIAPGIGTAIGAGLGTILGAIDIGVSNPDLVNSYIENTKNGTIGELYDSGYLTELFSQLLQARGVSEDLADTLASIPTFFMGIGNKVESFFLNLPDNIKQGWDKVSGWFDKNVVTPISIAFSSAWDTITGIWNTASTWFNENVIQPVGNFFSGLWDGISKGAHDVFVIGLAIWLTAYTWFDTNVIQPVKKVFQGLWDSISEKAKAAWNACWLVWAIAYSWFNTNVITPVKNFFSDLWEGIASKAREAWNACWLVWAVAYNWFNTNIITPIKNLFSGLWDEIKLKALLAWIGARTIFANAVNWVISKIESGINGIISGINWFIQKFNGIGEWASNVTGLTFYYISEIQPVSLGRVAAYQQGGFPEDGFFYANHNELVGQFSNGKTAVANNEQIVEGIAGGVAAANEQQNTLLREQNRLLRMLLEKDSTIDVSTIASAFNRKNQRDGKVTVPVAL